MGLIETASGNSVWRGMDYYENKKVVSWKKLNDGIYDGVVFGSKEVMNGSNGFISRLLT